MKDWIGLALASTLLWNAPALAAATDARVAARPLWIASPSFRSAKPRPDERVGYQGESVRQDIRIQGAAATLVLHLTNELGDAPIRIGHVQVAVIRPDGTLGAARRISFAGRPGTTIEPGNRVLADALALALPAFADVAVTIFYPEAAPVVAHRPMVRISAGDTVPTGGRIRGPGIVSAITTPGRRCGRVVVALGDSITEGAGSTPNNDWPSVLARRLAGSRCAPTIVNAGIGGNQVLRSGGSPALLARFDRDVLAVPGVTDILFVEGINDIRSWEGPNTARKGSAQDLIDGYRQIVARAHAHGIRVIGGTLTPYEGTGNQTEAGLATVDAVNAAIRRGDIFDDYVDFNRAVADPANPRRMRVGMQKGDWLHPGDTGYAAMAAVVPTAMFAAR